MTTATQITGTAVKMAKWARGKYDVYIEIQELRQVGNIAAWEAGLRGERSRRGYRAYCEIAARRAMIRFVQMEVNAARPRALKSFACVTVDAEKMLILMQSILPQDRIAISHMANNPLNSKACGGRYVINGQERSVARYGQRWRRAVAKMNKIARENGWAMGDLLLKGRE